MQKNSKKQFIQQQIQLKPQIRTLLSFEYMSNFPQKVLKLQQLIQFAVSGIQHNTLKLKYGLKNQHLIKYGIKNFVQKQYPFQEKQRKFIEQLCLLCQTLIRKNDYVTVTQTLGKLNTLLHGRCHHKSLRDQKVQEMEKIQALPYRKLQVQEELRFHQKQVLVFQQQESGISFNKSKLKVHLIPKFKEFNLNFKYINFKEAMIYQALSRCQIWFTICRQRRKSGKGFYLDSLINTFDSIVKKAEINASPFHVSVLPRKNIKGIQKKKNIQKSKNALFEAVANRKHNQVKQLILNGADLEAPAFWNQRLVRQLRCSHKAAENNDLEMCKILTSFGVNWEAQDNQQMTPIFYTIQGRSFDVLKYLVEEVKVNIQKQQIQDRSPFYWACTEGQLHIIKYLYEHGANINHKSKLGRCPLSKACYLGRRDIVQFLLSCKQIDFRSQDGKGRTPLHNATFGAKGGRQGQKFGTNASDSPQCALLLLQKGFEVDLLDFQQNSALHIAASSQAIDSIRILVAHGASLSLINNYGQTPLMTAAKFGHVDSVKLLYEQFHSSITDKDIFNKNVILLVAKFRQFKENSQRHFPFSGSIEQKSAFKKLNTQINPVFDYIVDKIIYQFWVKYQQQNFKHKKQISQKELSQNLQQLHYTFKQMLYHAVHQQFMVFAQKLFQFKVPFPRMKLKDVTFLLQMQDLLNGQRQRKLVLDILHSKNQQGYHVFQLQKQGINQFIKWLITKNNIKLLEFALENQVLVFYHFNKKNHLEQSQPFHQLPMQLLITIFPQLKQKIITFCLLNLTFNWIDYINPQSGSNILHFLVQNRKVGTIIQVTKLLGGKKMTFVRNRYLKQLLQKQQQKQLELKQQYSFKNSPINQIFIKLLWHQDNDGITPYQLAHIVKETSIIKIFSQRLRQTSLANSQKTNGQIMQKWDVKQYKIQRQQQNLSQLKTFQIGYQLQKQLQLLITQIQQCTTKQELSQYMKILSSPQQINPAINIDKDAQHEWSNFKKRPLHYIKNQLEIEKLKQLLKHKVIGIDVEYDFADGNQTIICTMQFSSLEEDYIVDMMSCAFEGDQHQNRYIPFVAKLKHQFFMPLCYDKTITKLMHGSDHDLYILKSCFNCSFINFLDSSRIDIDLRKTTGIRGLATLTKEYLNIAMSKDHQVSEWRIRPIPHAMLDYARRDSMILPFLIHKMLGRFENVEDLKETILNGFKHGKKNKRPNQPLIKNLIPI